MIVIDGPKGDCKLRGTGPQLCSELTILLHEMFQNGILNKELLDKSVSLALNLDNFDFIKLMQDDSQQAKKLRELLALISLVGADK